MQKSNPIKINPIIFFVSGVILMSLIGTIKYAAGDTIGLVGSLLLFMYGGFVGHLATTKHTSFLKNIVFGSVIFITLYALFSPLADIGNSFLIKKVELVTLVLLAIVFIEMEIVNAFRRMRNKKPNFFPGLIGNISLIIFLYYSGLYSKFENFLAEHWYFAVGFMFIWLIFLYFVIRKGLNKVSSQIVKTLGRGR